MITLLRIRFKGGKVRFKLSRHLSILLFIAGEPQKLDRQKYISLESSFCKLFKNTTFRHFRSIGKNLSRLEVTIMDFSSFLK